MPVLWPFQEERQANAVDGCHIFTVTLRFSPRLGFAPVIRALANSYAATAALDGPSHSSAVTGRTFSTQTFGSSGPLHYMVSVLFQTSAALA